jgi:UDP-4-amino-4,6-dideoxy-N-acetyl-beta-L-altrosamine transaminase
MIPYGRQSINGDDIRAVIEVLRSDFLTQGPAVPRFERAVAERCGARHACAANSATSALHLAYLALGLGPGDMLWTSPNSFVASSNAALYCGADVDFVDIDPDTGNLSTTALEVKLRQAASAGRVPKIVVPVHFAGQSCDMADIHRLAMHYGFSIVEDASHAIGGRYQGEPVGACRYSDITVFSFHPVKIVTTGEGGMLLTNDAGLHAKAVRLRSHGITRDPALMERKDTGGWYYEQLELGFNYRLTDIQAALGTSQVRRLDELVGRRTALADRYDRLLSELPLRRPARATDTESSWHLYVVQLAGSNRHWKRRQVFESLRAAGVGVNVHYIPIHTQPYYRARGFRAGDFPNALAYYQRALSLPLYPDLGELAQDEVVRSLAAVLS